MYYRKEYEKKKFKKLSEIRCYVCPAYYDKDKQRYIRIWKSSGKNSVWAVFKRAARKRCRRRAKELGFYSKKLDDPRWNAW